MTHVNPVSNAIGLIIGLGLIALNLWWLIQYTNCSPTMRDADDADLTELYGVPRDRQ